MFISANWKRGTRAKDRVFNATNCALPAAKNCGSFQICFITKFESKGGIGDYPNHTYAIS